MTFRTLAVHFSSIEELPISVDSILDWIRDNTDHKIVNLHPVERGHKAFRGSFRRYAKPSLKPYNQDPEIITEILYGEDMDDDWKRLVIVKEALHVFDSSPECVNTPDGVRMLIPAVIHRDLQASFLPAEIDHLGAFKALVVLIPKAARTKLQASIEAGDRSIEEIARYCRLPDSYVDIWLRFGDKLEDVLYK